MVRNWVAGLLAAGGVAAGALIGPHVPGLAASGSQDAASGALADRMAIEGMVTRYYGNFGRQDGAEDFGVLGAAGDLLAGALVAGVWVAGVLDMGVRVGSPRRRARA